MSTPTMEIASFGGTGRLGGGGWIERENPARVHEIVGRVEQVDEAGAGRAVELAHLASVGWASTPVADRCALLATAADAVAARAEDLGPVLSRELGKVVADCRGEMGFAAAMLRHCVAHAPEVLAATEVDDDLGRVRLLRVPYGVVVAIVPWNAPLILSILKVAPALVCGNTVVVKPSPLAPLAVTEALATIAELLPPGCLSVLHGGPAVGAALVAHPLVRKVAFTGGDVTARAVGRAAAEAITPTVMELGGNDPAIVLDDAPFDEAIMEALVHGTFLTAGQVCMAAKRLYVPAARFDEFVESYLAAADRVIMLGDPMDPGVTMGPLVSDAQRRHVAALVDGAVERGAVDHELGGSTSDADPELGYFLTPTLVTGCRPGDPLVVLEQFGPTVPVLAYDSIDEVVAMANDSELGLGSSVWSADEDRAVAVAERLEAGMTFINCHNRAGMSLRVPFGGVKQSGFGREFGIVGIEEYTQLHAIHAPAGVRHGARLAANAYPGQA